MSRSASSPDGYSSRTPPTAGAQNRRPQGQLPTRHESSADLPGSRLRATHNAIYHHGRTAGTTVTHKGAPPRTDGTRNGKHTGPTRAARNGAKKPVGHRQGENHTVPPAMRGAPRHTVAGAQATTRDRRRSGASRKRAAAATPANEAVTTARPTNRCHRVEERRTDTGNEMTTTARGSSPGDSTRAPRTRARFPATKGPDAGRR